MPTTTLGRVTLYGSAKDQMDPFTRKTMERLLHKAGLYVVEENTIQTRTLVLKQDAPTSDKAPSRDNVGEEFSGGDGHHELARVRETAGLTFDEGEE